VQVNLLISPRFWGDSAARAPFLINVIGRGKIASKVSYSGIISTFTTTTLGSIDY
jgi:hypothetical protein